MPFEFLESTMPSMPFAPLGPIEPSMPLSPWCYLNPLSPFSFQCLQCSLNHWLSPQCLQHPLSLQCPQCSLNPVRHPTFIAVRDFLTVVLHTCMCRHWKSINRVYTTRLYYLYAHRLDLLDAWVCWDWIDKTVHVLYHIRLEWLDWIRLAKIPNLLWSWQVWSSPVHPIWCDTVCQIQSQHTYASGKYFVHTCHVDV